MKFGGNGVKFVEKGNNFAGVRRKKEEQKEGAEEGRKRRKKEERKERAEERKSGINDEEKKEDHSVL